MGDNDSRLRKLGAQIAQPRKEILVRQSMETIPPNALCGEPPRQGESLRHPRLGTMESGVETRDLRHLGRGVHDGSYRGEVVRLVQRRQRFELRQFGQHLQRHADGSIIAHAAVDHTVSNADDGGPGDQRADAGEGLMHRRRMIKTLRRPSIAANDIALRVGDFQARRDANSVDLSPERNRGLARCAVNGELHAGRACVDHGDAVCHARPPVARTGCLFDRFGFSRRNSRDEIDSAVNVDRAASNASCERRRQIRAGVADVHDVDQLPERRLVGGFVQHQLEILQA